MGKIHQLPDHIIAKIAAGEVIERPAFAVKELVENAIDAKATHITIQLEQAGLKKIVVTDNGEGMSKEDVLQSFKSHTTSKLSLDDSLESIKTLGFRGEALASIAGISEMLIVSREKNVIAGTVAVIDQGKLKKIGSVGTAVGTSITIINLFVSVPGRKKFLKSAQTEFRHIASILAHFALSYPDIHFTLIHNNRQIFDLHATETLSLRIQTLVGFDDTAQLVPVSFEDSYIRLHGFLAKPQYSTINQNKQFLFINKRMVKDRLISQAVKDAFSNLLEPFAQPIFILFLSLPYEMVDVNIHPRKEQVSFVNNQFVYEMIVKAIKETLAEHNITFANISWKRDLIGEKMNKGLTKSYASEVLRQLILPLKKSKIIFDSDISQLQNLYLITQTDVGLLLIDQHAAHERILYEKLLVTFGNEKNKRQIVSLPQPLAFNLSLSDTELLQEHIELFGQVGFIIEHTKKHSFQVLSVPILFQDRNIYSLICEMLDDLSQEKMLKTIDQKSNKMISYLACRAAIKAGDFLSKIERKKLLQDLEKTPNNTTCPHGRPTRIEIFMSELNKLFRRE